ncbi:hypothetical protein F5Y07DRAFT_262487 [Xylaria sp. FL0933]|nr:hypothetical protein F5Y07DRAFT_262487 [Xylaria sp. FL0933]
MQFRFSIIWFIFQLWITPSLGLRRVFGLLQPQTQFLDWYEQYGYVFANYLKDDCSQQYQNYLYGVGTTVDAKWVGFNEPVVVYGPGTNISIDFQTGGDCPSSITQPVINCLFNHTSDYIKSAMSSAQVLLGLTPTILAVLGPSPTELSLLTVIARRPGLALLLSLACPSVYLARAFDNASPIEALGARPDRLPQRRPKGRRAIIAVVCEYLIVAGIVANVAVLYWQLGTRTVCMFWSGSTVAPLIWGILVVPIHIVATLVFRLKARRVYSDKPSLHTLHERSTKQWIKGSIHWLRGSKRRVLALRHTEFKLAVTQDDVYVDVFPDTVLFIGLKWFLTPGIILHVIFGTLVLSSLTFIGPRDAVEVIGRFMVSVLLCRALLMYEIAGIRDRFNSPKGGLVTILPFRQPEEPSFEKSDEKNDVHKRRSTFTVEIEETSRTSS